MDFMCIGLHNTPMEFDAINVFVKVVEAGSFSGAAKLLQMPKTTVSAKVAALERRLGVTLIQRTTRKLNVTEAGRNYFRHCVIAIKEVEQAESELFAAQDKPKGLLRVTAPVDLGHSVLPKIVCEFLKKYPETEIEMIISNRMVDLVGEGVDLAIRAGELKDSTLVARKFFEIQALLWASPAYLKQNGTPEHPRELKKHQVMMHSPLRSHSIELTDGKASLPFVPGGRIAADDLETIKALAVQKAGIAWLPSFLVERELKTRELVQVLPKWWLKHLGVFSFVYPGQKYASPKVRAFIDVANQLIT